MLWTGQQLPAACRFSTAARCSAFAGSANSSTSFTLDDEFITGCFRNRLDFVFSGGRGANNRECRTRRFGESRLDFCQFTSGSHTEIFAVVVGRIGLSRRLTSAHLRLGSCVIGLALLIQERRNGDRGEKSDDQDYNQELDKR